MRYNAGQMIPYSGKVEVVNKSGEKTKTVIQVKRGEVFPPTPEPDQQYVYISYTDN